MKAYDFTYDGQNLSDFGFMLCEFDGSDMETISNGSEITFNTTSVQHGAKTELLSSSYDSCLEATFQICRDVCVAGEDAELDISISELRELTRWLNRKDYLVFKLIDEDGEYDNFYFEGSFNVSKIIYCGRLVGLELTLTTNRPFALQDAITKTYTGTSSNWMISIDDTSDEEGYIYPYMEIAITSGGDLTIYNLLEDRTTYISDCVAGETITMEYPIIKTSSASHEIQNNFNWYFPRIANTYSNRTNNITVSLPCSITISYSPIAKVGLE